MHEYQLTPVFFSQLRSRMALLVAPLGAAAGAAGIFIGSRDHPSETIQWMVAPVILAVLAFSFLRSYRQQMRQWATYRLQFERDVVICTHQGFPDTTIARADISRIVESPGRSIAVQGSAPNRLILIPSAIENFDEIRTLLAGWHAIESRPATSSIRLSLSFLAVPLLTCAAMVAVMVASDPFIVIPSGSLLIVGLPICVVLIQRNPLLPKKTKRTSWLVILPWLTIVAKVIVVAGRH